MAASKADPTGTWEWKVKFGGQEQESSLGLQPDGGKLTGAVVGRDSQQPPIEDISYKDGDASFKAYEEASYRVTRERDGRKFTIKYKGKMGGGTTQGKAGFDRGGETRTRDWEARRARD